MKHFFLTLLAVITISITAKAQSLELVNNRTCTVYFRLWGGCPGSPCSYTLLFAVPPTGGIPVVFPSVPAAIPSSTTPLAAPPSCGPGFAWHMADVQNDGCCDGGGMTVGDGMCGPVPFSRCIPVGEPCNITYCSDWITIPQPFGSARVVAY
jgi:hypothetical protein